MPSRNRSRAGKSPTARDIATENYEAGHDLVAAHPMLGILLHSAWVIREKRSRCPEDGWAVVTSSGRIYVHPTRRGSPEEWAYVLAHCLLHLGFNHFQNTAFPDVWNTACDCYLAGFLARLKFGQPPEEMLVSGETPAGSEQRIYDQLHERGIRPELVAPGTAGKHPDLIFDLAGEPLKKNSERWAQIMGEALVRAVTSSVEVAAGIRPALGGSARKLRTLAQQARSWFISSYPLLGALAASFTLIEDPLLCTRMGISVAAVHAESKEIYVNPNAGLNQQQYRFVLAHELLHVGLRHETRRQGRDPYFWNIATDYIINAWLIEMGVGELPPLGLLYDPELKGLSAEAVYDRIVTDMRRYRKLHTLRGVDSGDILDSAEVEWWTLQNGADLDAFYRRALCQGLEYHYEQGRGFLPGGLVEEIRALDQPPIPWDVELAQWFDHHFPLPEKMRSYARPHRHQSATPDIPRPSWVLPPNWEDGRTFGVLLDTSGSMDRVALAKALGAIASYSIAREVPAVRLVFCDAATYDEGYVSPEDIAGRVRVRGRGGTILQPGVDLLEHAPDFPDDGPLLIITDGLCDVLHIRREHAFLLPQGRHLPFVAKGEVFYIS
jgi:predicted metal-dependent peptidase